MTETIDIVVELLSEVLSDGDVWKVVIALLLLFAVRPSLAVEVGRGIRYVVRWIRCYIFGQHTFEIKSAQKNMYGQLMSGTRQCVVCLLLDNF